MGDEEDFFSKHFEKLPKDATIGRGAQATVKLVKRKSDGKLLACKKIGGTSHMEKEYELLKKLSHPNVIEFVACSFNSYRKCLLIFTEYCEARDLVKFFAANKDAITEGVLWQIFFQVGAALAYCHHGIGIEGGHFAVEENWEGIVHRDIKPSNVLVSSWNDERIVVKVCDFGVSREYITTTEGTNVGSLIYRDPEISNGRGWTFKSDVYSLGVTMRTLTKLNPDHTLWTHFSDVISKCEEKGRQQRICIISLLQSIPKEFRHRPSDFQIKTSNSIIAEDQFGFASRIIAIVVNSTTDREAKRLHRLIDDLEGDVEFWSFKSALGFAAVHGFSTTVDRIFELKEKFMRKEDKETALHVAAEVGLLAVVEKLANERNFNVNAGIKMRKLHFILQLTQGIQK